MSEAAVAHETALAHPLDRVIWNSLTSTHRRFAVGGPRALRFAADVAPFAALADTGPASIDALHALIEPPAPIALVTPDPVVLPGRFIVERQTTLLQMVWLHDAAPEASLEHVTLAAHDVPEMLALVRATQPGPFGPRTIELGDYIGVRSGAHGGGTLAAMAGERMKIDGYTEISAVCVDPAFRGQGLGGALMKRMIGSIRARGETPFLHVLESNHGAIALYRALGFVVRRKMHLMVVGRAAA